MTGYSALVTFVVGIAAAVAYFACDAAQRIAAAL